MSKLLSQRDFIHVIRCAPLVAIDLVVSDPENRILLGKRVNAPARGQWFVPGGRIFKGETLETAFARICLEELGVVREMSTARWVGVFTHLYPGNAFSVREEGGIEVTTHYVVLAYRLAVDETFLLPPRGTQHTEYAWFVPEGMTEFGYAREGFHPYLRPYRDAVCSASGVQGIHWPVRGNSGALE